MTQEDDEQNFFLRKKEKKRKGYAGWRPRDDEAKTEFKKATMCKKDDDEKEGELETIQRSIEEAAKKIAHTTRAERQKEVMRTPKPVTLKQEAAARCTRPIDRKVLRNQARRARADHAVKCSLMPGKKIPKENPRLSCTYRAEWKKELQRHCEEVYVDPEETKNEQEGRSNKYRQDGDKQFTEEGRMVEITVDMVLQARAKMSESKVNGPEDVVVSEMMKQFPQEKIYEVTRCFQQRCMGQMDAPNSWKIVNMVFFAETRCGTKERHQKLQRHRDDVCHVEVVRDLSDSTPGRRKRT